MKAVFRLLKYLLIAGLLVLALILIYRMRAYLLVALPCVIAGVAAATFLVGVYHYFFVFTDPEQPVESNEERQDDKQFAS